MVDPVPPFATVRAVFKDKVPMYPKVDDAYADENKVEDAFVIVVSALKVLVLVNVLDEYVFGIVVEAFTKKMALVVENAAPWFCERKYSAEVVLNARPKLLKYEAEDVLNEFAR